jgi:hypothetical protein
VREARRRSRPSERHCTKLKYVSKQLIIKEILVKAAGVELIKVLRACRLLILGNAATAKSAPLPDRLYVYCTKIFRSRLNPTPATAPYSRSTLRLVREKTRPRFANLAPEVRLSRLRRLRLRSGSGTGPVLRACQAGPSRNGLGIRLVNVKG